MKLYDFHCNACGKDFEDLVREIADARCVACSSPEVVRKLSAFSVGGGSGEPSGGGCAGPVCRGGLCGAS
jgi:putative FmdB family regulatory protein